MSTLLMKTIQQEKVANLPIQLQMPTVHLFPTTTFSLYTSSTIDLTDYQTTKF